MLKETVETFKRLYTEKRDVIEYMVRYGNDFEKVEAKIIKDVALGL